MPKASERFISTSMEKILQELNQRRAAVTLEELSNENRLVLEQIHTIWHQLPHHALLTADAESELRCAKTPNQLILTGKHPRVGKYHITVTSPAVDIFSELRWQGFQNDGSDGVWDLRDKNALIGINALNDIFKQHAELVSAGVKEKVAKELVVQDLEKIWLGLREKNRTTFSRFDSKIDVKVTKNGLFFALQIGGKDEAENEAAISHLIVEFNEKDKVRMIRVNPLSEPGTNVHYPSVSSHLTGDILNQAIWQEIYQLGQELRDSLPMQAESEDTTSQLEETNTLPEAVAPSPEKPVMTKDSLLALLKQVGELSLQQPVKIFRVNQEKTLVNITATSVNSVLISTFPEDYLITITFDVRNKNVKKITLDINDKELTVYENFIFSTDFLAQPVWSYLQEIMTQQAASV